MKRGRLTAKVKKLKRRKTDEDEWCKRINRYYADAGVELLKIYETLNPKCAGDHDLANIKVNKNLTSSNLHQSVLSCADCDCVLIYNLDGTFYHGLSASPYPIQDYSLWPWTVSETVVVLIPPDIICRLARSLMKEDGFAGYTDVLRMRLVCNKWKEVIDRDKGINELVHSLSCSKWCWAGRNPGFAKMFGEILPYVPANPKTSAQASKLFHTFTPLQQLNVLAALYAPEFIESFEIPAEIPPWAVRWGTGQEKLQVQWGAILTFIHSSPSSKQSTLWIFQVKGRYSLHVYWQFSGGRSECMQDAPDGRIPGAGLCGILDTYRGLVSGELYEGMINDWVKEEEEEPLLLPLPEEEEDEEIFGGEW